MERIFHWNCAQADEENKYQRFLCGKFAEPPSDSSEAKIEPEMLARRRFYVFHIFRFGAITLMGR